jgi:hypothetical protein
MTAPQGPVDVCYNVELQESPVSAPIPLPEPRYYGPPADHPSGHPPAPEWGVMISEGSPYIVSGQWWMSFFPGAALMLLTAGFILMGDGLNARAER